MAELNLDRLTPGQSFLKIDDRLERPDSHVQGVEVPGFAVHLSGELTVDNLGQKVLVHGEFDAEREMECHRSGESFTLRYPVKVEVMILRFSGRRSRHEERDDDAWLIEQRGGAVKLNDALLEAVILDEPQNIVRPELQNVDSGFDDAEDEIDPRWEALRSLKDESDKD